MWLEFWKSHCLDNYRLPTLMGKWRESTHRKWEWYYDKNRDVLQQRTDMGVTEYGRSASSRGRSWTAGPTVNETTGVPASVRVLRNGEVRMR